MSNPLSNVLQVLNRKTMTLGWDVIVAYNAQAVNDLFAQQYVANVRASQHLPPINGSIQLAAGVTVNLINLTLGPPLISFTPSVTDQEATVLMNFIAGEIVVQQQSGSVSYVSAYQSIVPGDAYALTMVVQLAQTQGGVTSQNVAYVDLQNANTFQANLLPGTAAASLLGSYFQTIFQKETQGTLTYDLGTIVVGTSENLTPYNFDIRTQVYPGTQGPDGAVLLLVATTYNKAGGNLPGATFPYLIPDGNGCALLIASKTLFANILQTYYQNTLNGGPTMNIGTVSGSSPASYLTFTGGGADAGIVKGGWGTGGSGFYQVWSGTPGEWGIGKPDYKDVTVPFSGLTLQPENDLLSMQWSGKFSQEFAATYCWAKGCSSSRDSVSLTISAGFNATPTLQNNNVSFGGGSPSVNVTFEHSGWFAKYFGNGQLQDHASAQIAGAAQPAATAVLQVPLPQVDTFAVSRLLFPSQNALQYQQVYLPGDLALFGAIQPQETAFTIAPLQVTIAPGEAQMFTPSNAQPATWSCFPAIGSISPAGIYTAPPAIAQSVAVVVTATQGQNIATAVVVVVPSALTVSPAFTVVSPGSSPVQLAASVVGGLSTPAWTISPNDGSVGTVDANGLYTPPTTFPTGVTLATVTATASGVGASSPLCLVDAVFAFSLTPASVVLGPNDQQQFSVAGNPSVTWSLLTPTTGTISKTGLYTAPPSVFQTGATAIVMVQMTGNTNLIGLGVVILTPTGS